MPDYNRYPYKRRAPRGRVDLPVATWLACDIERRINGHAMDILNL